MLRSELSGVPYSKADHRRRLQRLLRDRSESAIELKHGNISAILLELRFPPVVGYKPYSNYQQLLATVVEERLRADSDLQRLASNDVDAAPATPSSDDILAALVSPPKAARERTQRPRPATVSSVDYLAREARNRLLGDAGEEFVVRYEQARLASVGQERLADEVEHVARTRGDGLGYDVLSFETNGKQRLIEVKTTRYGAQTPFFVTPNELKVSRAQAQSYHLYRVHEFRSEPRMFAVQGSISERFRLDPSQFVARIA